MIHQQQPRSLSYSEGAPLPENAPEWAKAASARIVRGCVNSTAVGAPVKSVGSVKSVGAQVKSVGAQVKSVGAPVKSVGAPVKSVGISVETVAEAVGVAVKHGNKFKRYDPGLHSGSWNYEGDIADGNAIVI